MRLTRRTMLQASLLGVVGSLSTTAATAESVPVGPTRAERERLAHLAADLMDWYEAPGLSVAIAMKGVPLYVEAFGFADKDRQETLTTQHRFRIASVTKPITSVGILLLMQASKLRLTDHVFGPNSILGDEFKTPPNRQDIEKITIEQLLTHTSGGWPNDNDDPMFKNKAMSHPELINWALETEPLRWEPGYRYAYSNFGYCLLGRVIEKITSQKYDQYIESAVLGPSGISDMQIAGNTLEERAPNEVKYYSQVAGQDPYDLNIARMDSHGGWIAAPIDLIRFAASIDGSRGKALLSPDTGTIMVTPSHANPGYAKGLFVNNVRNFWHTGLLPGTATLAVRTHTGFSWAAFVNTRTKFDDMLDSLDALMWHIVGSVDGWRA